MKETLLFAGIFTFGLTGFIVFGANLGCWLSGWLTAGLVATAVIGHWEKESR